jgi:hypothetical protein
MNPVNVRLIIETQGSLDIFDQTYYFYAEYKDIDLDLTN